MDLWFSSGIILGKKPGRSIINFGVAAVFSGITDGERVGTHV
jgi:hypothetical protein